MTKLDHFSIIQFGRRLEIEFFLHFEKIYLQKLRFRQNKKDIIKKTGHLSGTSYLRGYLECLTLQC